MGMRRHDFLPAQGRYWARSRPVWQSDTIRCAILADGLMSTSAASTVPEIESKDDIFFSSLLVISGISVCNLIVLICRWIFFFSQSQSLVSNVARFHLTVYITKIPKWTHWLHPLAFINKSIFVKRLKKQCFGIFKMKMIKPAEGPKQ